MVGEGLRLENVCGFVYDLLVREHQEIVHEPAGCILPQLGLPRKRTVNEGNVTGHGRKRPRFRCTGCGKTFSPRTIERRFTSLATREPCF